MGTANHSLMKRSRHEQTFDSPTVEMRWRTLYVSASQLVAQDPKTPARSSDR